MHDVTECKFCGALTPKNKPCEQCGYTRDDEEDNPQDIDWKEYGFSRVN